MRMKSLILIFLCSIAVGVASAGCIPDRTLDIVEEGIEELGRQPGRWEDTMESTIRQLERSGTDLSKNVLAEVRRTYNGMLGQTTGEFSCRSDFIAHRLQQRLQAIGHAFDSRRFRAPKILPVICSTNPADHITPDDDLVVYYGYDLLEFAETNTFQAVLQYADGAEVYSQAGYVARTHNYQLVLDLQSPRLKSVMREMNRDRGPQLVLKWGNQTVENDYGKQSALPIKLPGLPLTFGLHYAHTVQRDCGGGGGGREFPAMSCPGNYVGTGLAVMAGERIDRIRLKCSKLNSDGTTGQDFLTLAAGGGGGSPYWLYCPPNQALTEIRGRSGARVDQLQAYCSSISGSESFETGKAGREGGHPFPDCKCPTNYVITGIVGRSGQEIDRIGVICTEIARW